jgi:hypothetical protein
LCVNPHIEEISVRINNVKRLKNVEGGEVEVSLDSRKAFALILALVVASFMPLFRNVPSVYAVEPSLLDVFNSLGFTHVTEIALETFPAGNYNITLYAKFGGNNLAQNDTNELSYYRVNTTDYNLLYTPSEPTIYGYVTPPLRKTFSTDYTFGFSLLSYADTRYFSETVLNPDNTIHVKVYVNLDNPSMLLVGFDERSYCTKLGDLDFNDMVFSLQLQYHLNVVSPYDAPTGQGWYYNGTIAFASLASGLVDHGNGTRRVFTQWSTDASGNNYTKSGPILMNQNKTALAVWNTEYYLTVKTIPNGLATVPGENWYTQGTNKTLTAPAVAGYAFTHWDVDGFSKGNGTNPVSLTMNEPHTASAHYVKTYLLTIVAGPGGTTNPTAGTQLYPESSTVLVTANPSLNYKLDHWELDGIDSGSINPYVVTMNGNHTLKAVFKAVSPPSVSISPLNFSIMAGQSVTFHSTASGGTPPYSYQWYLDGNPVSGEMSDSWIFTPGATGIHYVYLMVTDQGNSTGQSETARIEVSYAPVGGYTISLNKRSIVNPLTIFIGLFVGLSLLLVSVKRKTRKVS